MIISKPAFTIIPWPRGRHGAQVMLQRFVSSARQHGYRVWPDLFTANKHPCLFLGHPRQSEFLRSPRRLVYRIAGMYIEEHFRRFGEAFADRSFKPEYAVANQIIREALIHSHFVIYQSAWSKEVLDSQLHGRQEGTWAIIPNAVPLHHFKPALDWPQRQGKPLVLGTAGFLRSRPRLEVFFDVAGRLPERPRLLLVGQLDHYCQKTLDTALANPYWQGAIHYVPSVSPEHLPAYYRQMDCLLHPVIGDACPNVVVEALACGVPVVCPREGGTAEIVGPAGVAVDDPERLYSETLRAGMAEAVQRVFRHLPHYKQLARKQAEENNDIEKLTIRYLHALGFSS
ncbi:glycosyltransferase family 4 protein [Candidatus Magnetaquicoccus inordinatus]|uniref:glycosyltransferase family 4 protein n=1 Tax=Candidatus Magnetaquicoccus inordinatus TaxID=2496818 RepID=UPI00102D1162|nr:glycosyltransferase family 4 protein [Candidatus Magnetaquicoccus inordinatus]